MLFEQLKQNIENDGNLLLESIKNIVESNECLVPILELYIKHPDIVVNAIDDLYLQYDSHYIEFMDAESLWHGLFYIVNMRPDTVDTFIEHCNKRINERLSKIEYQAYLKTVIKNDEILSQLLNVSVGDYLFVKKYIEDKTFRDNTSELYKFISNNFYEPSLENLPIFLSRLDYIGIPKVYEALINDTSRLFEFAKGVR